MAKRGRVPAHKSLGPGKRKRNKNPKLSPFQREQKRDRLANQPPIETGVKRDFPAKQRGVYMYLQEKEARDAARREAQSTQDGSLAGEGKSRRRKRERAEREGLGQSCESLSPQTVSSSSSQGPVSKKSRKEGLSSAIPSLNAELKVDVQPLNERTDLRRLQKKDKKHQKRLEKRKVRISENMMNLEQEINRTMLSKSKKAKRNKSGRGDGDDEPMDPKYVAYEKELVKMQKQKAKEDAAKKEQEAAAAKRAAQEAEAAAAADTKQRKKKIAFSDDVTPESDAPHQVAVPPGKTQPLKKAKDFYEYVDVVRFGERVEAPPVFERVPRANSALGKLASKLEAEEEPKITTATGRRVAVGASLPTRTAILSGSSSGITNPSSIAERKRLASLGLAPRPTELIVEDAYSSATSSKKSKPTNSNEFELLRQKVMESYQRSKFLKSAAQSKAGNAKRDASRGTDSLMVDLKHQFPAI